MSDRTCSFDGCEMPHDSKGYCRTHNSRIRTHGDPYGKRCETCRRPLEEVFGRQVRSQTYCSDDCRPRCAAMDCTHPARKVGFCDAHYVQNANGGTVRPVAHRWAAIGGPCVICGRAAGESRKSRLYCSSACQQIAQRYPQGRPDSLPCGMCGDQIDVTVRVESGRLTPVRGRLCSKCAVRRKFKTSVFALAVRDGAICRICTGAIDMSLTLHDSLFCPSIDHVKPRTKGGTDHLENLVLAHFWCNSVKSDREGFTI
jgi:hypothetical protein